MANENTSAASAADFPSGTVSSKNTGDTISADTFNQMLDVLDDLATHSHIFYDDYATVCECQCQCACSRGTI
jgi:hypothetical protein